MIIISYSKEDKNTAKRLSSKLEGAGYKCWIEPRDLPKDKARKEALEDTIKEAELMILVLSQAANKNEDLIDQYDQAFEEEVPIIPFVVSDLKLTLSMQHLLNTHDWINAFDSSFEDAMENLIDLMETEEADTQTYERREPKARKQSSNQIGSGSLTKSQKQKIAIGAVAGIFIIAFAIVFALGTNGKQSEGLIGSWKLTDYSDNLQRQPEELADFQGQVTYLRQNFEITFNENNTFERRGFADKPEYGTWELTSQNGQDFVVLKPTGSQVGDALLMKELEEGKMELSIATTIDSMQVITTLTLQKN